MVHHTLPFPWNMPWIFPLRTPSYILVTTKDSFPFCLIASCMLVANPFFILLLHMIIKLYISPCFSSIWSNIFFIQLFICNLRFTRGALASNSMVGNYHHLITLFTIIAFQASGQNLSITIIKIEHDFVLKFINVK